MPTAVDVDDERRIGTMPSRSAAGRPQSACRGQAARQSECSSIECIVCSDLTSTAAGGGVRPARWNERSICRRSDVFSGGSTQS